MAETALRWAGSLAQGKGNDAVTGSYEDLGCGDERTVETGETKLFPTSLKLLLLLPFY